MFRGAFFLFLVTLLASCGESNIKEMSYNHFNDSDIWVCHTTKQVEDEMNSMGKRLANPMSKVVIVYFFDKKNKYPDVGNFSDFNAAREFCVSMKPDYAYWKYANGKTALIQMNIELSE
jgi:hypothetical protein